MGNQQIDTSENPKSSQDSQSPQGSPKPKKGFMNTLAYYLGEKAPQLPKGFREFLVNFAPWISIVALVLAAPSALALFGFSMNFGTILSAYGYGLGGGFKLMSILILAQMVLQIIALPGLFAKKAAGWTWTFYAVIVSAVASLVVMNIIGAIIGALIGFYFLFQIRSYYH